tara:strand:+ start:8729 stop:8896 length:168 start_codon:yes stop_codon:yes gene_type:complete
MEVIDMKWKTSKIFSSDLLRYKAYRGRIKTVNMRRLKGDKATPTLDFSDWFNQLR